MLIFNCVGFSSTSEGGFNLSICRPSLKLKEVLVNQLVKGWPDKPAVWVQISQKAKIFSISKEVPMHTAFHSL